VLLQNRKILGIVLMVVEPKVGITLLRVDEARGAVKPLAAMDESVQDLRTLFVVGWKRGPWLMAIEQLLRGIALNLTPIAVGHCVWWPDVRGYR
jgi:hypothetical protein